MTDQVSIENPMVAGSPATATAMALPIDNRNIAPNDIANPFEASEKYRSGDYWESTGVRRSRPGSTPALPASARPLLFGGLTNPSALSYELLQQYSSHLRFMLSVVTGERPGGLPTMDPLNMQVLLALSVHGCCKVATVAVFPLTYVILWMPIASCRAGKVCAGVCFGIMTSLMSLILVMGDLMMYLFMMTLFWPLRLVNRKFAPICGAAWMYSGALMLMSHWTFGVLFARVAYRAYLSMSLEELQKASTARRKMDVELAKASTLRTYRLAADVQQIQNFRTYLSNLLLGEYHQGLVTPCPPTNLNATNNEVSKGQSVPHVL